MRRVAAVLVVLAALGGLTGCGSSGATGQQDDLTPRAWSSSEVVGNQEVLLRYRRLPGPGCGVARTARVEYQEDAIVIGLLVDLSSRDCALEEFEDAYSVVLDEPVDGRTVIDANA